MTFAHLYNVTIKTDQQKQVIKADHDLFRRIIIAIEGGRDIDIDTMLQQELSPVPLSLAKTNGRLHESDKPNLATLLQEGNVSNTLPLSNDDECMIIDQRL